jgi:hypothetical protein
MEEGAALAREILLVEICFFALDDAGLCSGTLRRNLTEPSSFLIKVALSAVLKLFSDELVVVTTVPEEASGCVLLEELLVMKQSSRVMQVGCLRLLLLAAAQLRRDCLSMVGTMCYYCTLHTCTKPIATCLSRLGNKRWFSRKK